MKQNSPFSPNERIVWLTVEAFSLLGNFACFFGVGGVFAHALIFFGGA